MSTLAITMMTIGCSLVWGGLLVCLWVALQNDGDNLTPVE